MWATILAFLQVVKFFIDLYLERNKAKADEKAVVGKEIIDAFAEADPKTRAGKLVDAVNSINVVNRMHGK